MIQGLSQLITALKSISNNTQTEQIPKEIAGNFRGQILEVGAVDKGRFLQSADFRQTINTGNFQQFLIDSSKDNLVTYGGYIEVGTYKMPARFPAQRAIEKTELKNSFDVWINSALG